MEKINGVTALIKFNGRVLSVDADGYLGMLAPGLALLETHILPDLDVYGFEVNGKKNVMLKKDWAPSMMPPNKGKVYQTKVQVVRDMKGFCCTKYPDNHMRLLELIKGGKFRVWEIALVSQHGHFFLTTQRVYEASCYRNGQQIVCPYFEGEPHKWPQLVQLLRQLLIERMVELKPISEHLPDPKPSADGLFLGTGRVLWWNFAQGLGAIITPEGVARVHWSNVVPRGRLAFLTRGEIVRYRSLRTLVPTRFHQPTLDKEAIGVESII
jgi:hypothetical protein